MSYLLRDVDPDWWRLVKAKAARDGLSIREVILSLLRAWLRGRA